MNRRLLLILIYLYALIFSVLKTIRLPNDWSEAHWMLDYRFGFIKRGFAGEIFGFFFEKNEFSILVLSTVILLCLYFVIFVIAIKNTDFFKAGLTTDFMFYVLFFLSQYVVFSAHLIGYLDHLIFLMTFLIIYFIRKRFFFLSSIIITIALFIHEIALFITIPICFFTLVVVEFEKKKRLIKKMVILLLLPLISTLSIVFYQEKNDAASFQTIFTYLKNIKFISTEVAQSVSYAYTNEFTYYLKEESPHFFQRIFISKCCVLYGIPILFMMFLTYEKFRNVKLFILVLLGICTLIPLLLHSIAWDTYRIWAFPFIILFIGFWVLSSEYQKEISKERLFNVYMIFFILSFFLITIFPNPLFDHEIERFSLIERTCILIPFIILVLLYTKSPKTNLRLNN